MCEHHAHIIDAPPPLHTQSHIAASTRTCEHANMQTCDTLIRKRLTHSCFVCGCLGNNRCMAWAWAFRLDAHIKPTRTTVHVCRIPFSDTFFRHVTKTQKRPSSVLRGLERLERHLANLQSFHGRALLPMATTDLSPPSPPPPNRSLNDAHEESPSG